jgi:hypothetical protein
MVSVVKGKGELQFLPGARANTTAGKSQYKERQSQVDGERESGHGDRERERERERRGRKTRRSKFEDFTDRFPPSQKSAPIIVC